MLEDVSLVLEDVSLVLEDVSLVLEDVPLEDKSERQVQLQQRLIQQTLIHWVNANQ